MPAPIKVCDKVGRLNDFCSILVDVLLSNVLDNIEKFIHTKGQQLM